MNSPLVKIVFAPAACLLAMGAMTLASTAATAQVPPPGGMTLEEKAKLIRSYIYAPVVVEAVVDDTDRIRGKAAEGLGDGKVRYRVEAETARVFKSPGPVPEEIRYLVDMDLLPDGKRPRLKHERIYAFLREAPGSETGFRLNEARGQKLWTSDLQKQLFDIAREVARPEVGRLQIEGITSGYRVEGDMPGEAEARFFLSTKTGNPVSLVVSERGDEFEVRAALEDNAENLEPIETGSVIWYHFACSLPDQLPASVLEAQPDLGATIQIADTYRIAREDIGPCPLKEDDEE